MAASLHRAMDRIQILERALLSPPQNADPDASIALDSLDPSQLIEDESFTFLACGDDNGTMAMGRSVTMDRLVERSTPPSSRASLPDPYGAASATTYSPNSSCSSLSDPGDPCIPAAPVHQDNERMRPRALTMPVVLPVGLGRPLWPLPDPHALFADLKIK